MKQIIDDINQALKNHGLLVTAHNSPEHPEDGILIQVKKHPNPHSDAHPDGLTDHPEKHPESSSVIPEGEETDEQRIARKRAAFLGRVNSSPAFG